MSEYTTVYLRSKATPLLDYREHSSFEETRNLSKDEIMTAIHEVDEYNKNVRKSFGCELFPKRRKFDAECTFTVFIEAKELRLKRLRPRWRGSDIRRIS